MTSNPIKLIKFIAEGNHKRIDLYLIGVLDGYSRGDIQRLIFDGKVTINNKIITKKNTSVNQMDQIEIILTEKTNIIIDYNPTIELKKLFEDENLLVIDKPYNFAVHPGASKDKQETILDILMFNYPDIKQDKDTDRPGIVHRLDKETSGVLILAKKKETRIALQEKFKNREIKKCYLAILHGKLRFLQGQIEKPIIRSTRHRTLFVVSDSDNSKARYALTYYKLLYQFNDFCWVKLFPHTGRTHQLRVHMKSLGNPIMGDTKYGINKDPIGRLGLHAYSIEFIHPHTGNKISVYSPFPKKILNYLKNNITKYPRMRI